jgi:uncharacterized protein (TIGR02246 family)
MPLLLALLVLAGAQTSEPPATVVARMWSQYTARIVQRDADAVAALFTDTARLMEPGSDDVVGRPFIRALLDVYFKQTNRPTDMRVQPRDVVRHDSLIYDQGEFIQTMAPLGDPRRAYDVYGRYFAVWAEQPDGAWKLARLMTALKKQPAAR